LWDEIGSGYFDFLSANFTPLPSWSVDMLREQASRKSGLKVFISPAVGQQCRMRPTALISDRPGFGVPPSTFAWQAIKASWLSRPYGTP
ncbi:MAG: hypothetical protein QF886_09165, partial [Planctomycetota bacterium]|nr:hypothetical protein [Planctomycetota bacterium]